MSPKTSLQNQQIRDQTRERILRAAFELFAQQGFESTSMDQIARRASISKGNVYNHFVSKESLLKGTLESLLKEGEDIFGRISGKEDPKKTFTKVMQLYFEELTKNNEHWRLVSLLALQVGRFQFVNELSQKKYKLYINLIQKILKKLGIENYKEEAYLLAAIMDGLALQHEVVGKTLPIQSIMDYMISKYLKHA
ncbi:MAG TPA: TetR/AcrR family transcriptional regulator [Cyclobacteriaceae bacterium]